MPDQESFTNKEQELIAIGASIAAGCRPCTAYHFKAAAAVGATREEIRRAVDLALETRRSAATLMAHLSERLLSAIPGSPPPASPDPAYLEPLISAAAALAINCASEVARHVSLARDSHATGPQVQWTFEIARAVKKMAGKRVEAAAERIAAADTAVTRDEDRRSPGGPRIPEAPGSASAVDAQEDRGAFAAEIPAGQGAHP